MKKSMLFFVLFFISVNMVCFGQHFLTFIIPCFNCEQWIEEAVESIYQQELSCPFEVICTDDGSTDETFLILSSLALKHPEMKIISHEKNRGGGAARNTCVLNSEGDIIFCLDADNVLVPNSVQKLINHMDKTGTEIVSFGSVQYFVNNFEKQGKIVYHTNSKRYGLREIFQSPDTPGWSGNYLYSRNSFDAAGGYPEEFGAVDTFAFSFMKLIKGFEIAYVPDTFYYHRHGIESYYIREAKSNKLNLSFLNLLSRHQYLFTSTTIKHIKNALNRYEKTGVFAHDVIWFIANKKIQLKKLTLCM